MARKSWQKRITVDRRIVKLLSASTYEDFPGSIREMVSNAYDADANKVDIRIDIENDSIVVSDDGNGMTPDEFDFFLRIAGQERGRAVSPEFGRSRIGQFGIGFMAIFPFAKRIQVTSTARRSDVSFQATIPTRRFISEGQKGLAINVEDIQIPGFEDRDPKYSEEHGTTVSISGLTDMVKRYFQDKPARITTKRLTKQWPPMDQLGWVLREDLPIEYRAGSPYQKAFSDLQPPGIRVHLNGKKLYRNVHASHILENDSWEFNGVRCRYIIASDWKSVVPDEARHFKIRLHNVGIGERTSFKLGVRGRAFSRLHWLTGEIHILEGFDALLTIDRKRFAESHAYDQFREYFRDRLAHWAYYVEHVSEAERDIKRQLAGSRVAEVDSTRAVVDRNIEKLRSKGFKIVTRPKKGTSKKAEPIEINVQEKVVKIVKSHPAFSDTMSVASEKIPIRYTKWDPDSGRFPAVMRATDGTIEVNTEYPLFRSRRYGAVFEKVLVLMLVLSEKAKSPQTLFSKVAKLLQKEFSDLR